MIVLSQSENSEILPRQSIIFNKEFLHSGNAEIHEIESTMVKLRYPGIYMISFSANLVGVETDENLPLILGIRKDGELISETVMTTISFGNLLSTNVSTQTRIRVNPGTIPVLTVENIGENSLVLLKNCSFVVHRVG